VTSPGALSENDHKDWQNKGQLHVSGNRPAPEEAAIVRCLEVGHNVSHEEQLGPPVVLAVVEHQVGRVPDGASSHRGEHSPAHEEYKVVQGSKSHELAGVEHKDVVNAEVSLNIIEAEKLVRSQESGEESESFHHDVAIDDDSEDHFLEEVLDHPGVNGLSAHEELGRITEHTKEVTEELKAFDGIKFAVVPQLALRAGQALPDLRQAEGEDH
jgi:hypothetical protein